jgi:Mor family transcriptional regulator
VRDLKNKINAEALNNVYRELSELVGYENMQKIHNEFRGQQITFPVELCSREYIHKMIRKEYNGKNVNELAIKYGYNERSIRRILGK